MIHRAALLALLLLPAVTLTQAVAPRTVLAAPAELDQARAMVKQAQPHLELAMNPDNSPADRKKGRKAAYKLLKEARRLFDTYLDASPGQTDSLDSEYCSVSANLYWIKKFATLNEFRGGSDDRVVELPPVKSTGAGEDDADDDAGGIGGASDTPTPPVEDDPPGKDEPPPVTDEPPPATEDEVVAPVLDAEALRATQAREVFAALQQEEARRPADVAHLHALYEKFLFEYDDPTLPEYQKAALKLGALTDRMRVVLKEESGVDPDDFDAKDSAEVTRVVKRLSDMLRSREQEDRRRASALLGKLGSGAAGFPLAKVLFDKDEVVAKNAADGLVAIGGKRVAENLTKLYHGKSAEHQAAAVDVLSRICAKGDVDGRSVAHWLGRFVLSNDDAVSGAALTSLGSLGRAGVDGLLEGLKTKSTEKRVDVIRALGDTGFVPATRKIALYLLPGSTERAGMQRNAAFEALDKFGLPAVPYLIPMLKDGKRKVEIRNALTRLTGQRFSAARPGDWQKWWKRVGSKQVESK